MAHRRYRNTPIGTVEIRPYECDYSNERFWLIFSENYQDGLEDSFWYHGAGNGDLNEAIQVDSQLQFHYGRINAVGRLGALAPESALAIAVSYFVLASAGRLNQYFDTQEA